MVAALPTPKNFKLFLFRGKFMQIFFAERAGMVFFASPHLNALLRRRRHLSPLLIFLLNPASPLDAIPNFFPT